jgi:ubiquinone/menaquinone biosynthesis C-methylase UbiE
MAIDPERPWLFDEFRLSPWDTREAAEDYARNQGSDPAKERELLLRLGLSKGDTLIDLGCGAGPLTLAAAAICRRVIAVDISAAMLDAVRARAESMGLHNIEYVHAGFLTYEHTGEPIDMAVTRHVLHHLPDFWKVQALHRVAGLVRPGGTFYLQELVYSFEPGEAEAKIRAWIDRTGVESGPGFPRSFFEEHVRERYSTYSWLFESMLARTGFELREATYHETGAYAQYTCTRT